MVSDDHSSDVKMKGAIRLKAHTKRRKLTTKLIAQIKTLHSFIVNDQSIKHDLTHPIKSEILF